MVTKFTVDVNGGAITWTPRPDLSAHLSTAPSTVQVGFQLQTTETLRLVAGLLDATLSGGGGGSQLVDDLNAALREVAQRALIRSGN